MYFLEILLQLSFFFSSETPFVIKPSVITWSSSRFGCPSSLQTVKVLRSSPWKQGRVGEWNLLCSVIFVVKLVCSDQQHRQKQFPRKPKHSAISRQLVKNPEETGVAGAVGRGGGSRWSHYLTGRWLSAVTWHYLEGDTPPHFPLEGEERRACLTHKCCTQRHVRNHLKWGGINVSQLSTQGPFKRNGVRG